MMEFKPCTIDGCDRRQRARKMLCIQHYTRWAKTGDAEYEPSECTTEGCNNTSTLTRDICGGCKLDGCYK